MSESGETFPKVEGYGRYQDDPNYVGCPRAKSDMTPCVARDGKMGQDDLGECVGCGAIAADLLSALVRVVTKPDPAFTDTRAPAGSPGEARATVAVPRWAIEEVVAHACSDTAITSRSPSRPLQAVDVVRAALAGETPREDQ